MASNTNTTQICCSFKKGDRVMTAYGAGTVHSHWGLQRSVLGSRHSVHVTLDAGPLDEFQTSSTYALDLLTEWVVSLDEPAAQISETIDSCQFVAESLYTDTRVWEVIKRTTTTMTLRSTRMTDRRVVDMRCDEGAYGLRPEHVEVEPDTLGVQVVVRRRQDGSFRIGRGNRLRPITGTPTAWIDRRF